MDINVYENIKESLKKYFSNLKLSSAYNPDVRGFETSKPNYPLIIFTETRNVPYTNYAGSLQTVANLGYRFDIYAKTSGSASKQQIARTLAKHCDDFARFNVDLRQVSWNEISNEGTNGALYHIIILYSGTYYEQRLKFI